MPAECNIGEAAGHSITGNLPGSNWMPSDFFFFSFCVYVALFFPFFFFFPGKQSPSSFGVGELENGISEKHVPAGTPPWSARPRSSDIWQKKLLFDGRG